MSDLIKDDEVMLPMYDRVLVKIKKVEEKTAGGVLLPEQYTAKIQRNEVRATIVALGPIAFAELEDVLGAEHPDLPKVGDSVLIPKHAGQAYADNGKVDYETRIIHAEEVIAVLRSKT